jgi:hypothetical protein
MSDENEVLHDEYGFDESTGIHNETGTLYDPSGFDMEGIHETTETEFSPITRRTRDGEYYDSEGYTYEGYNEDGYDRDGYDSDGYDCNGEDSNGNTRCVNGECCDDDCDCHHTDFDNSLMDYGTRAHREHGWAADPARGPAYMYAGHEIEMYSDDEDFDDVEHTLAQVNDLYRKLNPLTRNRKCAIAKRDGSLDEYGPGGFELVTVPLTTEQVYGIFGAFKTLGNGRCSAWNMGEDVGHHIHLSKAAIGPLTLGKLLVFMNAEPNRAFLEAIACRPAGFNKFRTKRLTQTENSDRYEVLNVTNTTVEFRLFKSNLYSRAILKNHEFAVAAVKFCEQAAHGFGAVESSLDPLHFVNFRNFVAVNRSAYRYLHEFLLSHPLISGGYRSNSPLPASIANPKERSPVFNMIRTSSVVGA